MWPYTSYILANFENLIKATPSEAQDKKAWAALSQSVGCGQASREDHTAGRTSSAVMAPGLSTCTVMCQ